MLDDLLETWIIHPMDGAVASKAIKGRMKMSVNFEFVTSLATEEKSNWSNLNKLLFHYYNPNGLCERKRRSDELVRAAVDAGKAPPSALYSHGSLNDFAATNIRQLINKNRISNAQVYVALEMAKNAIEKAKKYLEENEVAA